MAPIVLDVLFDHYLTRDWRRFSVWDRDAFIDGVYRVLTCRSLPHPPALARVASRWVDADWLRVYETLGGVAAVLDRLARRASRPLPLRAALDAAAAREDELAAGFREVFADVRARLDGLAPRGETSFSGAGSAADERMFPTTPEKRIPP